MITSTIIENGKTIRTWQESRGQKTFTRVFMVDYRVNAICNGKWYNIAVCGTLDDAEATMRSTMKKVEAKYATESWYKGRTPLTYVGSGFWRSSGGRKSVSLYITAEGGKRLKETLEERPVITAVIRQDGEGQRIPWVYAHGRFEKDLGIDIFDVDRNGEVVRDGMKALYHDKVVVFHLYRNADGQLTGIATYADDEEACAYGRSLVAKKPELF